MYIKKLIYPPPPLPPPPHKEGNRAQGEGQPTEEEQQLSLAGSVRVL
jgi:hypothetical protein